MLIFLSVIFLAFSTYAQFGKGDILFKVKDAKVGDVLFSHKIHAGFQHINCEYCHDVLLKPYTEDAKEKHKNLSDVIDKLFCNNCHNGAKAFSTDDKSNCKRCHSIVEKNNKNGKKLSN